MIDLDTVDFQSLTDEEMDAVYERFQVEFLRRQKKREAENLAREAALMYSESVKDDEPLDVETLNIATTIGPSGRVLIDGKVWKNVSDAWLSPFTAGPDQYPQGWARDDIPRGEETVPAWRAGVEYKTGDEATFENTVFKCIQAHTAQAGWEPSNVPALWARK